MKHLVKILLSRNFCQKEWEHVQCTVDLEITKVYSQCGKMKILLSLKKNSSNQLSSNFFSKNVIFTKFLPKMCDSKFPLCLAQKIRVPSVFTKKDHSIIKRFHEKYQVRFLSRSSTSYSNLIGASLEIC